MRPDSGNVKGGRLRPTTGKVREALFNILRAKVGNACFLDLYAGTGAVGIGALREGASEAVFVESGKNYSRNINNLIRKFGFSERAVMVTKKVLPFLEWANLNRLTFDIIFLDPPYHSNEIMNALSAIGKLDILRHEGVVVAEHFAKKRLPERFGSLHKVKDYIYGDTVLSFYETS